MGLIIYYIFSILNEEDKIVCPELLKVKCTQCGIIGHPEILCDKREF